MASPLRKMSRARDRAMIESFETWLEYVKSLSLSDRLALCYQVAPGLRYSSQLAMILAVMLALLSWVLVGAVWPEGGLL